VKKPFCDYCSCPACQYGETYLSHAETSTGKWICDVCYCYEVCQEDPVRKGKGPCEDYNCKHRPTLISDWIEFKDYNENR